MLSYTVHLLERMVNTCIINLKLQVNLDSQDLKAKLVKEVQLEEPDLGDHLDLLDPQDHRVKVVFPGSQESVEKEGQQDRQVLLVRLDHPVGLDQGENLDHLDPKVWVLKK